MPFPKLGSLLHKLAPIQRFHERLTYDAACQTAPGRFIDLPLGRCHLVESGEGPPLILLHGFLYSTFMWEPVMAELAKHFRVIAVDLMGWGYSARDDGRDYNSGLYAQQLEQVMDSLGLERASLVGQSMGGGTAIRFAAEHSARIERIVLVDAASLPNPPAIAAHIFALPFVGELLLTAGGNTLLAKNLKDLWFYQHDKVTPAYVERVAYPLRIQGSSWTALNILRTLDFGCQTLEVRALGRTTIPTLLVWGREDRAVPLPVGQTMHSMLPGSELFIIDRAGHSPHEEEPQAFLERAIPFLKGE